MAKHDEKPGLDMNSKRYRLADLSEERVRSLASSSVLQNYRQQLKTSADMFFDEPEPSTLSPTTRTPTAPRVRASPQQTQVMNLQHRDSPQQLLKNRESPQQRMESPSSAPIPHQITRRSAQRAETESAILEDILLAIQSLEHATRSNQATLSDLVRQVGALTAAQQQVLSRPATMVGGSPSRSPENMRPAQASPAYIEGTQPDQPKRKKKNIFRMLAPIGRKKKGKHGKSTHPRIVRALDIDETSSRAMSAASLTDFDFDSTHKSRSTRSGLGEVTRVSPDCEEDEPPTRPPAIPVEPAEPVREAVRPTLPIDVVEAAVDHEGVQAELTDTDPADSPRQDPAAAVTEESAPTVQQAEVLPDAEADSEANAELDPTALSPVPEPAAPFHRAPVPEPQEATPGSPDSLALSDDGVVETGVTEYPLSPALHSSTAELPTVTDSELDEAELAQAGHDKSAEDAEVAALMPTRALGSPDFPSYTPPEDESDSGPGTRLPGLA
ncbi:hypothetical protein J8273_6207 [Carpediemonas membranifera]|uniref:Uncharacterized protein n=1 Tax=Carpediemonas membranifera TaxID=201153 RepID=A0A8J6E248_9EUKA|nr:hypothetical protein J8273_6207 [Carpediemonas membranifera]|eukprot:KAG9391447.1 hypothetical protein J8273_6207 [Carpediemonas membranifera]